MPSIHTVSITPKFHAIHEPKEVMHVSYVTTENKHNIPSRDPTAMTKGTNATEHQDVTLLKAVHYLECIQY